MIINSFFDESAAWIICFADLSGAMLGSSVCPSICLSLRPLCVSVSVSVSVSGSMSVSGSVSVSVSVYVYVFLDMICILLSMNL